MSDIGFFFSGVLIGAIAGIGLTIVVAVILERRTNTAFGLYSTLEEMSKESEKDEMD